MPREPGVLASFAEPAAAARAIRALRAAGLADVQVAMWAAYPEVMAAVGKPRSLLGLITLPGALLGLLAGLALTVGTSLAWPLVTGGKPIVSLPPFVIVTFEVTVLVGSLVNLVALLFAGGRGGRARFFPAGARVPSGAVGVFVAGGGGEAERVLRESGAAEVTHVA